MKIIVINTQNKSIAKEMLIRIIINLGKQYIEMKEEILLEDCLIKFNEIEDLLMSNNFFLFDKEEPMFVGENEILTLNGSVPKQKKLDYKKQSKLVNEKLKMNQNYNNRRRY